MPRSRLQRHHVESKGKVRVSGRAFPTSIFLTHLTHTSYPLPRIHTKAQRDGRVLHRFASNLPGGSPKTTSPNGLTVLDCVFSASKNRYYATDVLVWAGFDYTGHPAEYRMFVLRSKLEEEQEIPVADACSEMASEDARSSQVSLLE